MKKVVMMLLPLILLAVAKPVEAQAARGYYDVAEMSYIINADRTLSANENYVIVNTSAIWVITSTSKTISSSDVNSVSA